MPTRTANDQAVSRPVKKSALTGALLVALSAASFGTMPLFAVWAYHDGVSTWALLTVRFGVAALVLAIVLVVRRIPLPPYRRTVPIAIMGAGYVGQSVCYFTALHYASASLVSLLLYLFPAFVAVLAALFLHERLTIGVAIAVAMSVGGTALLVGAGSGRALGILLGVGAAVIYAVYITIGTVVTACVHPLAVTTIVCTAAAAMSGTVALLQIAGGDAPTLPKSTAGWGSLVAIAVIGTVVAIMSFFAGLQRLGATRTAVLSSMEPVLTIALATWLLEESMSAVQLCGAVIILAAVIWQALARRPSVDNPSQDVASSPS